MSLTTAQAEALARQDDRTLAEWWCELNRWKWPEGLPDPESPDVYSNAMDVRWSVMQEIAGRVEDRLISRVWNKDMPDDVFESFWRRERGPGTAYGDWCEQKSAARIAAIQARADKVIASDLVLEDILDAEVIED